MGAYAARLPRRTLLLAVLSFEILFVLNGLAFLAFAAPGSGSMLVALGLPRVLDRVPQRPPMLVGGVLMVASLFPGMLEPGYGGLLAMWFLFLLGLGSSLVLTPAGRLSAGRLARRRCRAHREFYGAGRHHADIHDHGREDLAAEFLIARTFDIGLFQRPLRHHQQPGPSSVSTRDCFANRVYL